MTKTEKVLAAFKAGEKLTAKQIAARFSVGNPAEVVRQLRFKGFAIYSNPSVNSKGTTRNFYRLGTPSRKMVAMAYKNGYRALAAA
tara:strand:+ start:778 stop:1035 length:258 start_codon:yes stop_codon:yes gene_type:complete